MLVITIFSDNIVEEGLQMMHHTNFLKRCLAQPRLLLRTFLLGMLLTGCFAVMAGFGASMASAQSLNEQAHGSSHRDSRSKPKDQGQGNPATTGSPDAAGNPATTGSPDAAGNPATTGNPDAKGTRVPVTNNNTTGSGTNAAGSNNSSGAVPVGGVVPGVVGVPGVGRPGLPFTGSDPGNNPLP